MARFSGNYLRRQIAEHVGSCEEAMACIAGHGHVTSTADWVALIAAEQVASSVVDHLWGRLVGVPCHVGIGREQRVDVNVRFHANAPHVCRLGMPVINDRETDCFGMNSTVTHDTSGRCDIRLVFCLENAWAHFHRIADWASEPTDIDVRALVV